MRPPTPSNKTVAPIRSGATACTLRAKKLRRMRAIPPSSWLSKPNSRTSMSQRPAVVCDFGATRLQHLGFAIGATEPRRFSATGLHDFGGEGSWHASDASPRLSAGPCQGQDAYPMDAKTQLKARLPSRHVTEGPERAPHRSYYYAMGLTTDQIHQPFVGVESCWNE